MNKYSEHLSDAEQSNRSEAKRLKRYGVLFLGVSAVLAASALVGTAIMMKDPSLITEPISRLWDGIKDQIDQVRNPDPSPTSQIIDTSNQESAPRELDENVVWRSEHQTPIN